MESFVSSNLAASELHSGDSFLTPGLRDHQNAHVGHIAVALGKVQAIPDDKLVRNREADIIGTYRTDTTLGLLEENRNAKMFRLGLLEEGKQILEGPSRAESDLQ